MCAQLAFSLLLCIPDVPARFFLNVEGGSLHASEGRKNLADVQSGGSNRADQIALSTDTE